MRSIIVNSYGGPEVLELKKVEKPSPKSNEVLIRIEATSVTAAATMMREGRPCFGRIFTGLTKPRVKTPGTDLSGVIEAIGEDITMFNVGDKVIAATDLKCGAYAEFICIQEDNMIIHHPENITAEEATGILDGGCTALAFFTDQVSINRGDKILINGASGSIGTAAIQLAKEFGADVTAVCSGKNTELVLDLGADQVFDYTKNELEKSNQKFDVIFDTVGKMSFSKSKKHLKNRGVFLSPVLKLNILITMIFGNLFSSKKLKFSATGLRKKELQIRDMIKIKNLLETGKIKTVIDQVYALEEIQEAHKYVDLGHKKGNVIIKMK